MRMPARWSITTALVAAILFCGQPAPAWAESSAAPAVRLLDLINQYRTGQGREPLAADDTLDTVALRHGEDMATRAYFAHVTPEGGDLGHRLWNVGYSFSIAAENLARGYRDAAAVLAGWVGSPGHKSNLLREDVSVAGIGVAGVEGKTGTGPVWVLVLARPRR
jgi:uncharacterized protein YkwD